MVQHYDYLVNISLQLNLIQTLSHTVHDLNHICHIYHFIPPREATRPSFISHDLHSSSHVFVRDDSTRKPLQPPYRGPYKVLNRADKYYTLDINGHKETVSIDRLKSAHLENTTLDLITPSIPTSEQLNSQSSSSSTTSTDGSPTIRTRSGRHVRFPSQLDL